MHTDERIEGQTKPPLQGQLFDSLDDLMSALNAWGRPQGLGFFKRQTANYIDGSPTYATIACDRGGLNRASEATTRRTTTLKTNCKWSAVAKALRITGRKWTLEGKTAVHNHEADGSSADLATHRVHRRLTDLMKAEIQALSQNPEQRPRHILSYLQTQFPGAIIRRKDITNYLNRLQMAKYGSLNPTQVAQEALQGGHGKRKAPIQAVPPAAKRLKNAN